MLQDNINTEPATKIKCDRRCVDEGHTPCDDPTKAEISSRSSTNDSESIHSGESIFKTFTFDAPEDDPDMKKCRAFWKTILNKNLKPMKCTLLPPKEKKKPKVEKQVDTQTCEEKTKEMLMQVYKDLQRKNLDKLKLVKKRSCHPCDEYIDEAYEKKQDVEDIKNLNDWTISEQQTPIHTSRVDLRSQVKKTLQALKTARSPNVSKEVIQIKAPHKNITKKHHKSGSHSKSGSQLKEKKSNTIEVIKAPKEGGLGEETEDEETPERHEETQETYCCDCGCSTEDCVCCDFDELKIAEENRTMCLCGCNFDECICDDVGKCSCGCGMKECVCDQAEELVETCCCGCGQRECVCEELITNRCGCGSSNCDCTLVGLINQYLDTLQVKNVNLEQQNNTKECQTEEEVWLKEATQKEGTYCIICGHFNCYCNE